MTGKERVLAAMKLQQVDRTPWVPFVGVHGGKILGMSASEFLKSSDKMVAGVQAAIERYQPDGIPVAFDLQIEAETFGCELNWSDDTPPAVTSHPLSSGVSLDKISVPTRDDGRIPLVLQATRELRQANPDIALYGLITGPFTLALHLMGTDIFMKMFDAPEEIAATMEFCTATCNALSEYYIEAGCDIVAVVDPMTSQIGPDQFKEFVGPSASAVFDFIHEKGAMSSFFVCGHAEQNLHVMCDCKPDNVSVDENIPLDTIKDICLGRGVSFGGNMQLTTVLLLGKPIDAQRNAIECMEIGGEKGFILAPGCDLPFDTPVENLEAVTKVVHDPYERDAIKAMAVEEVSQDLLDMSDYGQSDKVIVDIITLDSEACAPCQYMVESVKQIAPEFEGIVEWREHKIKYRESLVFMTSLMVRNIPTICIDGQIRFVSRIPARDELLKAVRDRILEKMRIKIARRRGRMYLLCSPDHCSQEDTKKLRANVDKAVAELGVEIDVKLISDDKDILAFGVLPKQTPAVVSAKYRTRSSHHVPEASIVKEWIKDIL